MGVKVAFWDDYVACVRKAGVPEMQVRWYVRWAERLARVLRDVPLRERAIEDVRFFLDDLRADERFAPWQVEHACQSLRILYRDHLGIAPHQMPAKRSTAPRDQVRQSRQLDAVHGNLLKALRDALRVRNYSPRTMEAYLGWVRRFIAFHALDSPSDLGAAHVREFLNHLAATKNVAASTQNQALNAVVFLYRHGCVKKGERVCWRFRDGERVAEREREEAHGEQLRHRPAFPSSGETGTFPYSNSKIRPSGNATKRL